MQAEAALAQHAMNSFLDTPGRERSVTRRCKTTNRPKFVTRRRKTMRHRRCLKGSASNACHGAGGLLLQGGVGACDCEGGHVLDGVESSGPLFGFDT